MISDVEKLVFPEYATDDERQINWQKIAEITDKDFGFDTPRAKTGKIRFNVRVLMEKDGFICVVKSDKYGYVQLPGGGIEAGESIEEALRRETREEIGFTIKNIEPVGYAIERRGDVRNTHDWDTAIAFVFSASPEKEVGTDYTEVEISEGFRPFWVSLEDFIAGLEEKDGKMERYSGCFSNRRDLEIARYVLARE